MASDEEEMEITKGAVDDDNDDDDDDDDSDDSSTEAEVDTKQEAELIVLRDAVQTNPFNYQAHLDYIALARQYGNLDHLRLARRTMADIFPLTEQLWLDWLGDEQKLFTSNNEKKRELIELFERALNDYLSVMIWIEYVQYRITLDLSSGAIDELRNLFERGLSSCGVHLPKGGLLWDAYRELEQAKLAAITNDFIASNNSNVELREKLIHQVDFILGLYRRQLTIPLRGMTLIHDEYNEFCQQYKQYLPANYVEQYDLALKNEFDRALQQLEEREKFEEELDRTQRSVLTYRKYMEIEKEPARIQCLYERAIVDNCLDGALWLSYIDFAEECLSSSTLLQPIFERSLRNCPWIAQLWIRYAEFMELNGTMDHNQLKTIYDRALNSDPSNLVSFVDIQLAYLQYRRRHYQQLPIDDQQQCERDKEEIRRACELACDQYQEFFTVVNDPKLFLAYNARLELYWIHLEIECFHSIDHARQIWNGRTLMSKNHNQLISILWRQYYEMEINRGDGKHARKVLYRALNHAQTMDDPLFICELLVEHEKRYGTIQQLKEANEKVRQIKTKLPKVTATREKSKKSQSDTTKKKPVPKAKPKEAKAKPERKISPNQMDTTSPPVQANGNNQQQSVSPRKRKLSPQEVENPKKKPTVSTLDSDGFKVPLAPPPPPSSLPSSSASTTSKEIDHLTTVFISNLAYDVTEDAIRTALASAGPIKEVRLVTHEWSNKPKGFGYVDFATVDAYREGLKLDHIQVNGRPMYISVYDPTKSTSSDLTKKFKYATTLEQNKLFISNLPFSTTKEQIQALFTQHGHTPKDIRIVTHRSGKSKGLAYVEFADAQAASQAVLKADGTEMDGHTIKVAISNPPQRKEPKNTLSTSAATSLGEAPKSMGPRGKGHSQIALIPRKIASTPKTTSTPVPTNTMSNDDFRKMLLNKK